MAFREKDRLAEDWHTLRIHDLEGFALFPERKEHRFSNMIYSYPLSDNQKAFIQADLSSVRLDKSSERLCIDLSGQTPSLVKRFMMVAKKVPKVYRDIISDLDHAHKLAFPDNYIVEAMLRYNSSYPQMNEYPNHIHSPVIVLSVEGDSTIIKNEEGGYFKPETAELILLGHGIEHYAPAPSDPPKPRATFLIG